MKCFKCIHFNVLCFIVYFCSFGFVIVEHVVSFIEYTCEKACVCVCIYIHLAIRFFFPQCFSICESQQVLMPWL